MEIREGYKQTEVGVIPEEWGVYRLADTCNISKRKYNPMTSNKNFRCIELEHISQGSGRLLGYVDSSKQLSIKNYFFQENVLLGKLRPYLRKYYYANFDGVCSTEIWVMIPEKEIDSKFLYNIVQTERVIEACNQSVGTKMPRAEWNNVKNVIIPIPPLPEQQAIATALSDIDGLISSLAKLIEKKKNIKQGAMQELLTPKDSWQTKTLKEVATYRRGSFPQPYGLDKWYDDLSGTPFVQVFDVADSMLLKTETKRKISKEAQAMSVFAEKGTVILTIQGSIGRIAITQYDAYIDRTLLVFENYLIPFDRYFFMLTIYLLFEREKQNAPGGIIKTITKEALSKFTLSFPSIEEQVKISSILNDMDKDLAALNRKLVKLHNIKQGMMQELLTGRIRLGDEGAQ